MIAIGLDTSTPEASVAAWSEDGRFADLRLGAGDSHSRRLPAILHAVLDLIGARPEDLDVVGVASGPGGFTGLRVGMATAKGIGLAARCPVLGFSTLETTALAVSEAQAGGRATIAVVMDAGRREVYRGVYRCSGLRAEPMEDEGLRSARAAFEGLPPEAILCGSGVAAAGPEGSADPRSVRVVRAVPSLGPVLARRGLARIRETDRPLPPLVPHYLRASDAERPRGS